MRAPYTQLYVHCVWATWDRLPLLTPAIEREIYACIQDKCSALKCEALEIGGDLDHVHLLARLGPSISVAQLVKEVKGASSHLITQRLSPGRDFKWQGAYGAFTVNSKAVDKAVDYIQRQKEHHAARRTWVEWEMCYEEVALDKPGG